MVIQMEDGRFLEKLTEKTKAVEQIVRSYLPEEAGYQRVVLEAMNYSMTVGGKRLRPLFLQETFWMFGGQGRMAEPFMAAMEMIHTYSLVHDDLPAMDNDEYRRGRRTTHAVYGEAFGILAGDALLNYAFETMLKAFTEECREGADRDRMVRMAQAMRVIAEKAGIHGMIGGQTADIKAEEQTEALTLPQLLFIHENKTAALIQAAMMAGAVLAGASGEEIAAIERCAYNVGIAFQIQDDILDVTGDSSELGKPVGSDARNHKQTYVTISGLEESEREVERLSKEAVTILESLGRDCEFLKQLVVMLIDRRK